MATSHIKYEYQHLRQYVMILLIKRRIIIIIDKENRKQERYFLYYLIDRKHANTVSISVH